jgi:two-component system chemotaxis response regulator CheY
VNEYVPLTKAVARVDSAFTSLFAVLVIVSISGMFIVRCTGAEYRSAVRRIRHMKSGGDGMKTVLLVDDNRDVLEVTSFMLEDAGYEVVAAADPEQALQVASSRPDIGVVVTDLNLKKGMSGIEMGKAMHKEGLKCPMIVMSGESEPEEELQSWMKYLSKPFDRKTLLAAITEEA